MYRDRLLAGHSVDIRDHTVGVNFYLTPGENMQADDISVRFSWWDNESVAELTCDSFDPEKQAYRATCELDISDKNEVITAEILRNGKVIAVRTYTLEGRPRTCDRKRDGQYTKGRYYIDGAVLERSHL